MAEEHFSERNSLAIPGDVTKNYEERQAII